MNLKEELKKLKYEEEVEVRNSTKFAIKHFGKKKVVVVEIGVKTGGHAETIFSNLNVTKLYLIDPWVPYKQLYKGKELKYYNPPKAHELTKKRFENSKGVSIKKGFSINIVRTIPDNSIDYLYIDGDHDYEVVKLDIETWKTRKADALTLLNLNQKLVPIFCTKHQRDLFDETFNYEFENSKLIGVQCYGLNDANTLLNLTKIKLRNQMLQTGDEAPLLIGLNYEKVLKSLSCVSGNFAYSCYGFDVLSCRQLNMENLPTKVIKKMINKEIEEIMRYDRILGGFNHSAEQEFWDGINVTRAFLENVDVTQGLSPYQAIQWANHREQQKDFDLLNKYILETAYDENALLNFINNEKEKWAVFYKTKIMQTIGVI